MGHDHDPTDLHGQELRDAEQRRQQQLAWAAERGDWLWLMDDKRGRRVVWRLIESAGVYRQSFHTTASIMAFLEGKRRIGLELLDRLTTCCPDLYHLMVQENGYSDGSAGDGGGNDN